MISPSPLIGTHIGPYRIDALLGQGGMAQVYKAWHTSLNRYEALKVLLPQMGGDASYVKRFLFEAQTAAHRRDSSAEPDQLALVDFCQALLSMSELIYVP